MNRTQRGDGSASNTTAPSTTGGRQAAPTPQAVGAGADVAARRRGGSRSVTSTRAARSQSTPPRAPPRPGQARAPSGPTPLPVPGPVVMPPASKGATTRQATSRGQLAPGEHSDATGSRWDEGEWQLTFLKDWLWGFPNRHGVAAYPAFLPWCQCQWHRDWQSFTTSPWA
jgi:hypothetical protein